MAAADPGQILRQRVGVLQFFGGQEGWAAERGNIGKRQLGEATDSGCKWHTREIDAGIGGNVGVGVELQAVRVHAVISETKLVDHLRTKDVGPAGGETAVGKILVATEEATAVGQSAERARDKARLIFEAEAEKRVVLVGEFLVNADVEVIARLFANGVGDEVVSGVGVQGAGGRVQGSQPHGERIETSPSSDHRRARNYVERLPSVVVLERDPAGRRSVGECADLCQLGIENLARVG